MKNTRIDYLYRDADNYKRNNTVIVRGEITEALKQAIMNSLFDGDGHFIPEQLDLPIKRPGDTLTSADHCFCELTADDFTLTDEAPTDPRTISNLATDFVQAAYDGWDVAGYAVVVADEEVL